METNKSTKIILPNKQELYIYIYFVYVKTRLANTTPIEERRLDIDEILYKIFTLFSFFCVILKFTFIQASKFFF